MLHGLRALLCSCTGFLLTAELGRAQGANLELFQPFGIDCPISNAGIGIVLVNRAGSPQTIPTGTALTLTFSAPVTNAYTNPANASVRFSGATVVITFTRNVTVQDNNSTLFVSDVSLNLQGFAGGSLINVTATVTPPGAIVLRGPNVAIQGIVDPGSCLPAPPFAFTFDDLLGACPSAQEVAAFQAALDIRFETDPTAGALVCRAANGSADLTHLQVRTFQALRLMQFLPFDTPLPWTHRSLYDWFVGAIRGIRFRGYLGFPGTCCDPPGYINIEAPSLGDVLFPSSTEWLITTTDVLIHEARHGEGLPHTCGSDDQTLSELGSYGVDYYFNEWAAFRSGSFLTRKLAAGPRPEAFRARAWDAAQSALHGHTCDSGGGVVASPVRLDFGTQPLGGLGVPRSVAITQTQGDSQSIAQVSLGGVNAADFALLGPSCAGARIPPSCPVVVRFAPVAAGPRTAELAIAFASGARRSVELRGIGGVPQACSYALSSSSQAFGFTGGPGTVAVRAGAGCNWEAAASDAWVPIASGRFGSGNGTVAFVAAPNPAARARQATLTIGGQTFTVTQDPAPRPTPQFTAASIVNAASFASGITPGGIATIFGSGLTLDLTGVVAASRVPLPSQLAGVSVEVNGVAAPLFAVANVSGAEQINLQVPWELVGQNVATVVVVNNGLRSAAVTVPLLPAHPGIFAVDGTAAILHGTTGQLVTPASPATRGEVVLIFATGIGPVNPLVATGAAAPVAPLSGTTMLEQVTIGGIPAEILFSGLAPNFVGLYQLNVRIPAGVPTGSALVEITAGGGRSRPAVIRIN